MGLKATLQNNLLLTYFIPDTPIGNFFFVLKRVKDFTDEEDHIWNCFVVLKVTNWIIAGNSPKCNNMIYFNAFNLKSDWAIKYITHFLPLYCNNGKTM